MRGSQHYLSGLSTLQDIDDPDERRATWRQSMATLAELTMESRGAPLEGQSPELLLASVRAAVAANLIEDLGFLSPPAAACALYGLASALPMGPERRELGRRVLVRLHEGDANTFVALATALALGSTRAFEGAAVRARVGLSLVLPIGTGTRADALALALISRRELAQRWLVEPSTGALPARRMASRLLERAAREATRRAVQGDDGGVWLFDSHVVQTAWNTLMSDREPLVWRHIATARGLLSAVVPRFAEEVERELLTSQSMARGRRGAASLAARVAIRPEEAVARARELLNGAAFARDPGMAAAMIYGLPRAAEVEPDAAEQLLLAAVEKGGAPAAEALVELRHEWVGTDFGLKAAEVARVALRQRLGRANGDDGHAALIDVLCEELGETGEGAPGLPGMVLGALTAFADSGARLAYEQARLSLERAETLVRRLELLDENDGARAREEVFRALHELDVGLLESSTMADLLCLGAFAQDTHKVLAPFDDLVRRLQRVLLEHEREPYQGSEDVPHLTLRMRRLRSLLHVLDVEVGHDASHAELIDERREALRLLLERVREDAPSAMDRIVHAAIARTTDCLVRTETFELSDAVLAAASYVPTPEGFAALSEGSMLPEVKQALKLLASLVKTLHKVSYDLTGQRALIESLLDLCRALPAESSPRTEGLRASLLRLSRALEHVVATRSLRDLADDRRTMQLLETAIDDIVRLSAGVRRRLGAPGAEAPPTSGHGVWTLGLAIERASTDDERAGLELTLETLIDSLRAELPPVFAAVILRVLRPLLERPLDSSAFKSPPSFVPGPMDDRPLPAWLPPARTLGGFYVLRALGAGAGGSVFVVKRAEERSDPAATELALKVPEYDGSAARALSEDEFMRMFRQEAGALLAVPPHRNLASFVTFDAGARPKPILVMELIEGPTLERVLAKGTMDVAHALSILDGILAGLDAMHNAGVGHLDVKPSNVILRHREAALSEPVLVDFGLAGRHVRPGCATGNYGAPEVWGMHVERGQASPQPVDVYALGCVAYEIMTGQVLFDAPTEMAMIAAHIGHDGEPFGVSALARDPELRPFAAFLGRCLRQDPRQRASVPELRRELREVSASLGERAWPLQVPSDAPF
jgi:hypothetical protein